MNGTTVLSGSRSFEIRSKKPNDRPAGFWALLKDAMPFTKSREVNLYRLRNLHNVWRGAWRAGVARFLRVSHFEGAVYGTIRRGTGEVIELGLISLRVVTDTGVGYIVDAFQNSVELENMKYHGYGTGTNAEAAGNTALQTELTTQYPTDNTRPTGTTTEGASANIYRTVATLDPDADVAITEHGIFSATSSGVLLDRSVFSAINLSGAGGDTLQTQYDLQFSSGS